MHKKNITLKELSAEFFKLKQARHQRVPHHALPRTFFKDNSANALTKAILAWFEINGIPAWRQNSTGRFIPGKSTTNVIGKVIHDSGRWIPSAGGKGIGDIQAILPGGKALFIEIKMKDRQLESQRTFENSVKSQGAGYILVRSWGDFIEKMAEF